MVNLVEAGGTATINVPRVLYNPMVTGTVVPSFGADHSGTTKPLAITEYNQLSLQCTAEACKLPEASISLKGGQQAIFYAAEPLQQATGLEQKAKYTLYGVDVTLALEPKVVFLNEKGYSYADTKVKYTILPPEYNAALVDVDMFKNGAWQGYLVGGATQGSDTATISAGSVIDVNSAYSVQAVLNRGSDVEIKGDQLVLPVAKINKIEVYDKHNGCNKAPGRPQDDNMLILAADTENKANPRLHVDLQSNNNAGQEILWRLIGNDGTTAYGDFLLGTPDISLVPLSLSTSYRLEAAIDINDSETIDSGDIVIGSFTVIAIPKSAYDASYDALLQSARAAATAGHRLSSSLLLTFLGFADDASIRPTSTNVPMPYILRSDDGSLSHVAGAGFVGTDLCMASINRYTYDNNDAAEVVANSTVIRDWVIAELNKVSKQTILQTPAGTYIQFPYKPSTISFGGWTTILSDAALALGTATSENLSATVPIITDGFGRKCIGDARIQGTIHDLYDFDYLKEDAPAILQFGWHSGLNGGNTSRGNIFWNTIHIDKSISLGYCW